MEGANFEKYNRPEKENSEMIKRYESMDFYERLKVPRHATGEMLRESYDAFKKLYPQDKFTQVHHLVGIAFFNLINEEKRGEYNKSLGFEDLNYPSGQIEDALVDKVEMARIAVKNIEDGLQEIPTGFVRTFVDMLNYLERNLPETCELVGFGIDADNFHNVRDLVESEFKNMLAVFQEDNQLHMGSKAEAHLFYIAGVVNRLAELGFDEKQFKSMALGYGFDVSGY